MSPSRKSKTSRKSKIAVALLFGGALSAVGCSNALETGYEPRALSSTSAVRRGYYASPFTPEAHAASMERDQELEQRRPKPGY